MLSIEKHKNVTLHYLPFQGSITFLGYDVNFNRPNSHNSTGDTGGGHYYTLQKRPIGPII